MFRTICKALNRIAAACTVCLIAMGIALAATSAAQSQGPPSACYPRDHLLTWLQERFGEAPIGYGVTNGKLIELLASEDGISWTIILTSPNGISCMLTGGEAWRSVPPPPKGPAV